jgi:NAD(P)-dependent dehydrogenase (short-subunit alcohol dehydrogenase family)
MPDASHPPFSLAGKVAIVTGGSRILGRAVSRGYAEHGATESAGRQSADMPERVSLNG